MSFEFYMVIEGTTQGKFKGTSPRDAFKDKTPCLAFNYGVISPRDSHTGQASGKRQHQPLSIVKEWDAATPQIFQALTRNEVLKSVSFEFVRTNPNGEEYVYHTIKLLNATVSQIEQYVHDVSKGTTSAKNDVLELEKVSFTFQEIQLDNVDGKTAASDNWHGNK
jgi:type VI secretion system secreted protein Hcp